jgi:predicted RNA-binding protein (virulence factor B family)
MVKIGKISTLEVVKFTDQGAYLDGGPYGEILLPNRYVPNGCKEEDELEVFIFFDSEDRIVASTDFPKVMADEFGYLKVVSVTPFGAFLDWGLPKDLLAPFREQAEKMEPDKSYLVRVYVDHTTGRIVASSKINKYLDKEEIDFFEGNEVDLIISNKTDLGYNAIINGKHLGILYFNEIFKPIKTGDKIKGFIKKIREDKKIDLSLEKQGYDKVDPVSAEILEKLKASNNYLPYSDKTDPDVIKESLGISKKTFKKAIGLLYKNKLIAIEEEGIRLA